MKKLLAAAIAIGVCYAHSAFAETTAQHQSRTAETKNKDQEVRQIPRDIEKNIKKTDGGTVCSVCGRDDGDR